MVPAPTDNPTPPPTDTGSSLDLGMIAVTIIAAMGLIFSFVTFALRDDNTGGAAAVAADGGSAVVGLSEFALGPASVSTPGGSALTVNNDGTQTHNLRIGGTDLITPDLQAGESGELDLSSLAPGEYEIFCEIPGHKEAGMKGTLTIGADGGTTAGGDSMAMGSGSSTPDWQALDKAMTDSMLKFPAKTVGTGNQRLEPTVLADGTKHFELTASIVKWEVEPGKLVDAWAYNGMVPGPWMKVEVGDKVEIHIQNDLPMGTDIHWHGVQTPNNMDGVAPITQELIHSGEDFTYAFTARRKAVGMYHAHHHGQMQIPNGLAGVFQIGDVDLPLGRTISGVTIPTDLTVAQELPMVLNDAGTIGLSLNGKSFPATEPISVKAGDWMLVHYLNEGLMSHPMHMHQFPQLVVAKDGIPLDNPYFADTINVAPGERYSVLVHPDEAGTWVWHCHILNHVEREDGMFGMVTALVVS